MPVALGELEPKQTGTPQTGESPSMPSTTDQQGELTRRSILFDKGPKAVFGGIAAYGVAKAREAWDTINREGVLAGLEQLNPIRESVTTFYHEPQGNAAEGLYSVSFARRNDDGRFHQISDENPYTQFTFDNLTREEAGAVAVLARGGVDNFEQLDPLTLLVIASITPSLKPLLPHFPSITRRNLLIAGGIVAGTLAAGGGLKLLSMSHEERSQLFDGLGKNLKGLLSGITTFNPFRGSETIKVVPTAWAQVQASTTPSPSAPVIFESTEASATPTIPKPTATIAPSPTPKLTETLVPTEVPRMPELKVESSKFMEGEKEVELRGGAAIHYLFSDYRRGLFRKDVDILHKWGARFLSVPFNSEWANDKNYVSSLVDDLEYARRLGFRIELVLHSRGSEGQGKSKQLLIADDNLKTDWAKLLDDSVVANRLSKSVDIFGVLSEPAATSEENLKKQRYMNWGEWLPIAENTARFIRSKLEREAIIAISGTHWAGEAVGAVNQPPTLPNIALEIHPYLSNDKWHPADRSWKPLTGKVPYFIGEIGYAGNDEEFQFVQDTLKYLRENKISFAGWGMGSWDSGGKNLIDRFGNSTRNGQLLMQYFK